MNQQLYYVSIYKCLLGLKNISSFFLVYKQLLFFLEEEEGLGIVDTFVSSLCFVVVRRCRQKLISPLVAFQCLLCVDVGRELRFSPATNQNIRFRFFFRKQNIDIQSVNQNGGKLPITRQEKHSKAWKGSFQILRFS